MTITKQNLENKSKLFRIQKLIIRNIFTLKTKEFCWETIILFCLNLFTQKPKSWFKKDSTYSRYRTPKFWRCKKNKRLSFFNCVSVSLARFYRIFLRFDFFRLSMMQLWFWNIVVSSVVFRCIVVWSVVFLSIVVCSVAFWSVFAWNVGFWAAGFVVISEDVNGSENFFRESLLAFDALRNKFNLTVKLVKITVKFFVTIKRDLKI